MNKLSTILYRTARLTRTVHSLRSPQTALHRIVRRRARRSVLGRMSRWGL